MERDENQENILEDIIRGPEDVGDVTSQFLNNSGEGDESLDRRDGCGEGEAEGEDRKSTRLNSSHSGESRMPSSA